MRWARPDNLADPCMAHYAIVRDGWLLAHGRNFHLDAPHSYVSRGYTAEAHCEQGLARALMASRMGEPQQGEIAMPAGPPHATLMAVRR